VTGGLNPLPKSFYTPIPIPRAALLPPQLSTAYCVSWNMKLYRESASVSARLALKQFAGPAQCFQTPFVGTSPRNTSFGQETPHKGPTSRSLAAITWTFIPYRCPPSEIEWTLRSLTLQSSLSLCLQPKQRPVVNCGDNPRGLCYCCPYSTSSRPPSPPYDRPREILEERVTTSCFCPWVKRLTLPAISCRWIEVGNED